MLDVVLSGFKVLRNTFRAVRETKARLNEALEEVASARRALDYVGDTRTRLEDNGAQLSPGLQAALSAALSAAKELEAQVRRKERLLLPLSRMIARLTRLFAGITRQALKARLAARGAHGLLERALLTLARFEARAKGELEELEGAVKKAKAGRDRAAEFRLLDAYLPAFVVEARDDLGALLDVAEVAADGQGSDSGMPTARLPRSLPAPDQVSLEAVLSMSLSLARGGTTSTAGKAPGGSGGAPAVSSEGLKKLLGMEYVEEAGRLHVAGCEAAGLGEGADAVPLEDLAAFVKGHAAENWGFQVALAAHRLVGRLAPASSADGNNPLLAKVAEISGLVLMPLILLAVRVGLLFVAAVLPPVSTRDQAAQNFEKLLMDELVEVARDVADGLLEGEVNMGALLQVDAMAGAATHGLHGLSEAFNNIGSLLDAANIANELEKVRALRKKSRKVADGLFSALTSEAAFESLSPSSPTRAVQARSAHPADIKRHVEELAASLTAAERTALAAHIIYNGKVREGRIRPPLSPRSPRTSPRASGPSFERRAGI